MDLQISTRKFGAVTILDLRGRIIFGPAADSFKAELRRLAERLPSDVIVNLSETTQIDSSGVGALVQGYVTRDLLFVRVRPPAVYLMLSDTGSHTWNFVSPGFEST